MRYRMRYNRRIIDAMHFEPDDMRRDAKFGGEEFEEADAELFEEIRMKLVWDSVAQEFKKEELEEPEDSLR